MPTGVDNWQTGQLKRQKVRKTVAQLRKTTTSRARRNKLKAKTKSQKINTQRNEMIF